MGRAKKDEPVVEEQVVEEQGSVTLDDEAQVVEAQAQSSSEVLKAAREQAVANHEASQG